MRKDGSYNGWSIVFHAFIFSCLKQLPCPHFQQIPCFLIKWENKIRRECPLVFTTWICLCPLLFSTWELDPIPSCLFKNTFSEVLLFSPALSAFLSPLGHFHQHHKHIITLPSQVKTRDSHIPSQLPLCFPALGTRVPRRPSVFTFFNFFLFWNPLQSGFLLYDSTKTALAKSSNSESSSQFPVLVFLYLLTTAFGPVGHLLFLDSLCSLGFQALHAFFLLQCSCLYYNFF